MRIFGVILAGGQARRMMGADKAMLHLGHSTLLDHAIARLAPQVECLAISANGDSARFQTGLPVLPDLQSLGPLSGILAALQWASPLGATAVVSVAVDTPYFPGDLVPRLCLAAETSSHGVAVAASGEDVHPTFGLWPTVVRDALRDFLASGVKPRVMDFARAQAAAVAQFPDDAAFMNLNTPDDLARAQMQVPT